MPTIKANLSKKLDRKAKEELAVTLTAIVAKGLGKPESVTQTLVCDDTLMSFGGKFCDNAFIVVMSIGGLTPDVCKNLSRDICAVFVKLGIPADKVYINFSEQRGSNWGWNSGTF